MSVPKRRVLSLRVPVSRRQEESKKEDDSAHKRKEKEAAVDCSS
jgi:hypothetical protein